MDLQTLELRRDKIMLDATKLVQTAEKEKRGLTDAEEKSYDHLMGEELEAITKKIARLSDEAKQLEAIERLTGDIPAGERASLPVVRLVSGGPSLGKRLVELPAFKALVSSARTQRRFDSPTIEIKASPLFEVGVVPTDPRGVIVSGPTLATPVAGLFAQGTTNSNSVSYTRETVFTNAAAAVAEGAAKPESTLTLGAIIEQVRKYAHWITVSKEALDDIQQIQSYIDARLRYGLAVTIDDALINGSTTPPELVGLLNRTIGTTVVQGAGESVADAILRQAAALQVSSGLPADAIVMNPADWTAVKSSKNSSGDYYGAGPLAPATPGGPTLWGDLRVAVSTAIPAKTALVGAFQTGAMLLWRETIAISVSNSHLDYFTKNLIAVVMEARLALVVSMPEAFGKVTLL
jgi:HK97 family phage major capsid protein